MKNQTLINTIIHGNCLVEMQRIENASIDMILCDLPYQVTSSNFDINIPFDPLWKEYKRIIKDNGAIVLTASQPFTTKLIQSNFEWYRYNLIWQKPQGVDPFMAKKRPLNNYEDICIFYKKQPIYNPQFTEGKPYTITRDKTPRHYEVTGTTMTETTTINDGKRYPTRIIPINQERGFHPSQKPVALLEYLIRTYTNEINEEGNKSVILDNCIGSGSTALACINSSRDFIGMEQEKKFVDIANERIKEALNIMYTV